MKTFGKINRIGSFGIATVYLLIVVASTLAVLPTQKASAELAPLPEPVSPGANCEWMGELHWERNINEYANPSGTGVPSSLNTSTTKISAVSAPVAGQDCGMKWAADLHLKYIEKTSAQCTGDPNDVRTYTRQVDIEGDGTGYYTAGIEVDGNQPTKQLLAIREFGFAGGTYTSTERYDVCGFNQDFNSVYTPYFTNEYCRGGIFTTKEGFHTNSGAQSYVGRCAYHDVFNNSTHSFDNSETLTFRFKKVNCDPSVDSDGGGTSDCLEYDDGTNPIDPSDDILRVSPEVQNVINIADSTGNQCFGKVIETATAESATKGKGVKQIIEDWDFTGINGVTEGSTFQQKKDALQSFCKTN